MPTTPSVPANALRRAADHPRARLASHAARRIGWTLLCASPFLGIILEAVSLTPSDAPWLPRARRAWQTAAVLLLVLGYGLHRAATPQLPTERELESADPRRRAHVALAVAALVLFVAVRWWSRHGPGLVREWAFHVETVRVYWTLVATPQEKAEWKLLLAGAALCALLLVVVLHRFVWRAFFPDFCRLDPNAHPRGEPERVGRLYRVRAYREPLPEGGERVRHRHFYKHGGRLFPVFSFDHVDLDEPAEPLLYGVALARCGRLERDPMGNRFRRIAAESSFAVAPLRDTFRRNEVTEDQDRKAGIVGPGPSMNPEVMRRKWQQEPSMAPFVQDRARDLMVSVASALRAPPGPPARREVLEEGSS